MSCSVNKNPQCDQRISQRFFCTFPFSFSLSPVLHKPFCFAFILSSFIFRFQSKPSPWIICFPGYFDFVSFSNLIDVYPTLTQFLILLHHDKAVNTWQYMTKRWNIYIERNSISLSLFPSLWLLKNFLIFMATKKLCEIVALHVKVNVTDIRKQL